MGERRMSFMIFFILFFFFQYLRLFRRQNLFEFFFSFLSFFFEESFTIIPNGLFSNIVSSISISEEMQ